MDSLINRALDYHRKYLGKIEVKSKCPVNSKDNLSLAYSPGVAYPCLEIEKNRKSIYDYTAKSNTVAVVTNGTAVLGLGSLGAAPSLPVMEGKAVLFKTFGGVDAFPICIDSENVDEIVKTVSLITSSFGGVNLEDIKAPECFEVEEKLKAVSDIPIFHDDQHGTAVVSAACIINALKIVNKEICDVKIVINGSGAAGIAIAKLFASMGCKNLILCDTKGAIYNGSPNCNNKIKVEMAEKTNPNMEKGTLTDVIKNADIFLGVSAADCLTVDMVRSMKKDPIILALANPNPEIKPELASASGAKVYCTGRSDYPNQVNNVLAFPGIFRGALDVRAREINDEMKIAAANAIASLISEDELRPEYVIPGPFDKRVAPNVARAVAQAAIDTGVNRNNMTAEQVYEKALNII